MNKTNKILTELLWYAPEWKPILYISSQSNDYIHRFCGNLTLSPEYTAKAYTISYEIGTHPIFMAKEASYTAALSIYKVILMNKVSISKDEVCRVCSLSTVTLNKLLKQLDDAEIFK